MNFQTITFILGIAGIVFTIYNYFRNPQITLEKGEGLMNLTIKNMQADLINLRDNHIHTLDLKMDATNDSINKLALEVTRLSTIIDERIPKK